MSRDFRSVAAAMRVHYSRIGFFPRTESPSLVNKSKSIGLDRRLGL